MKKAPSWRFEGMICTANEYTTVLGSCPIEIQDLRDVASFGWVKPVPRHPGAGDWVWAWSRAGGWSEVQCRWSRGVCTICPSRTGLQIGALRPKYRLFNSIEELCMEAALASGLPFSTGADRTAWTQKCPRKGAVRETSTCWRWTVLLPSLRRTSCSWFACWWCRWCALGWSGRRRLSRTSAKILSGCRRWSLAGKTDCRERRNRSLLSWWCANDRRAARVGIEDPPLENKGGAPKNRREAKSEAGPPSPRTRKSQKPHPSKSGKDAAPNRRSGGWLGERIPTNAELFWRNQGI